MNGPGQDYPGSKTCLSLCVVVSWLHMYYYMAGFERTGPFVLTFKRVISSDVPVLISVFLIPLVGFALCLSMLDNNGTVQGDYPFWNTARTIWNLIQRVPNMNIYTWIDFIHSVPTKLQWLSSLLLTSFYGFTVLIMLNLLIASTSNSYSHWSQFSEAMVLIERCNIMDLFDQSRTQEDLEEEMKKYCTIQRSSIGSTFKVVFDLQELSLDWYSNTKGETGSADQGSATSLFIIDPQVDFHGGGALAVAGAEEDSMRVADMIRHNKHRIRDIFVSLSSLHPSHIAHATFWKDRRGRRPPGPFTTITYRDVVDEVWRPRDDSPEVLEWCLAYTRALEDKGSAPLTIWPDHCIIGMMGHAVAASINEALQEWALSSKRPVTYVMTGQNCRTEMRSALQAEVEDPRDPATAFNADLFYKLQVAGRVQQPICFPSSIIIS